MFTNPSTSSRGRALALLLSFFGLVILVFMMPLLSGASLVSAPAQAGCPPLDNTPSFTVAYGQATLDQSAAPAGTIVQAFSPRDDLVGCFKIADAGYYGAMYVYGEDNSVTPVIPGMRDGEIVSFRVDGSDATVTPTLTWHNDRNLHQVDLSATAVPPSAIDDLVVSKAGVDLILSWTAVTQNEQGGVAIIDHYNVYRHTDPYFSFTPADLIGSTGSTSYTDLGAATMPSNYYYLITSVSSASYESQRSNRVGNFSVPVVPGWNLLALPLIPVTTTVDAILGDQLHGTGDPATADRLLIWDGASQSYDSAWYCSGLDCETSFPGNVNQWLDSANNLTALTLEPDTGFWVQNRSGLTETLVLAGSVAEADRQVAVGQSWQTLGSAFPISRTLDNANLPATGTDSPLTADRILYWDVDAQAYKSAWYCNGPICTLWGEPWADHWLAGDYSPTDIILQPGRGFWYQNRHDTFVWTNPGNN